MTRNKGRKAPILVVDDSEATLEVLQRNLEAQSYDVVTATNVPAAIQLLDVRHFDLVITDVKMPEVSGMDLVRHVCENHADTEITVITGYPSVDGAIQAMKIGAVDYLTKPFTDTELADAVRQALDKVAAKRAGRPDVRHAASRHGLLGESEVMHTIFEQIERASNTRATVLITGESGTGKELVARAIHYQSDRASAPFVPINCGAIPQDLLESELFGHVKGSFTGATESRAGFFLTADKGTIFLDEISETSLAMQVKLLRVLQDRKVCMVGSTREREVDVRIIAATNKDLAERVRKGLFRKDLFFRINVIEIDVPPLRQREDDIALLVHHFANVFADEMGKPPPAFTDRAMTALRNYGWPGNVRELENIVQRLVVMNDGDTIDTPALPSLMRYSAADSVLDLRRSLAEMEAIYVRQVLESVGGNKTRAAQILGIDRKTLRSKLGD